MLRRSNPNQIYIEEFRMQFGGKLRADNRWVTLSKHMPWDKIEEIYARSLSADAGAYAIASRIAFGSIYAKEQEEWTDRETLDNIAENPYLQYFLGYSEFQDEKPFDASMMVHFRKRFPAEAIKEINELIFVSIAREAAQRKKPPCPPPAASEGPPPVNSYPDGRGTQAAQNGLSTNEADVTKNPLPSGVNTEATDVQAGGMEDPATGSSAPSAENKGKLILDATCAPADIRYPTDISLLNESRENTEEILDILEPLQPLNRAQRRRQMKGRRKARLGYLTIAKQKRPGIRKIRAAINKQLKYVWKNIEAIGQLMVKHGIGKLEEKHLQRIMTICELYRQQFYMLQNKTHTCENRIVSLRQPHIRPIVRGKTGVPVEFGQKIALSVVGGYTFVDKQSFNNFNEGTYLEESVQRYKEMFGFYPDAVLADQIYRTNKNRAFCKKHGIRLSGPKLGRPKAEEKLDNEKQAYQDSCERNTVESRIGISKRRFGLDLIMCYLPETALTEAALQIMCTNFSILLQLLFAFLKSLLDCFLQPRALH